MHGVLQQVRELLGRPPRPFGPGKRDWHRAPPPPGFPKQDALYEVFEKQELLMREGKVVWGAVVQANNQLYQPGRGDHPATAIYCEHPDIEADPRILAETARQLIQLKKNAPTDGEERSFGVMLR